MLAFGFETTSSDMVGVCLCLGEVHAPVVKHRHSEVSQPGVTYLVPKARG